MNNDTYLKMVLALPDKFFEGWEWQAGDKFLSQDSEGKWSIHSIGDKLLRNGVIGWCFQCSFSGCEFECRPLPTQEQLQSICMKIIQCSPRDLLRFFEAWLYEDEIRPVIKFENFNDLWLKYAVWVWGRKEWRGSEWV